MKKFATFAGVVALAFASAFAGCRAKDEGTNAAALNAIVREHRELWVGERLLVKAPEHEGWTDLTISPNGKWATIVATYPFDAAGTRAENYYLVVNLQTGETIYHSDAQKRLNLKTAALAYEGWKENEPATLKIFLSDKQHAEVPL